MIIKLLIIYTIIMFLLTFIYHYEKKPGGKLKNIRELQVRRLARESFAMKFLEQEVEKRVKPSKRMSVEKLMEQAGYKNSFEEYVILSFLSAIVLSVIFGATLNNPFIAIAFAAIGFFVPHQYFAFIRNRRLAIMENQIGTFMKMTIARYGNLKDFGEVLRLVEKEFQDIEPMHSEIVKTIREIEVGIIPTEALYNMADRTENKYMKRFAAFFEVTSDVGTQEVRNELLAQSHIQFDEDYQLRRELKKEIAKPKQEAYIMVGAIPAFAVYQILSSDTYIQFMTGTTMGRIGTTVIVSTLLLIVWFINAKLGAPLD